MIDDSLQLIRPAWSVAGVKACTTTRLGGISKPPYDSFNLATHVGDARNDVEANRLHLSLGLGLPGEPCWLEQVHGNVVVDAARTIGMPQADAAYTNERGVVCAVLTADCLPVLFTSADGKAVAAAHAGWRGLANGVLQATVDSLKSECGCQPVDLLAWLGPAIGPAKFEVGDDVYDAFLQIDTDMQKAFTADRPGHWYADIYKLAMMLLKRCGVTRVSGGGYCTYSEETLFYSYRRSNNTGRMASLVWLE